MKLLAHSVTKKFDARYWFDKFREMEYIPPEIMDQYFAKLDPVSVDEMWGNWHGGYFFTGNHFARLLDVPGLDWIGKSFHNYDDVDALVYRIFSVIFGVPLGKSIVRMNTFRGKSSAAMKYKLLPVTDNFRKIDDNTLMGVMDARIPGVDWLYFYIYRMDSKLNKF